MSLDLSYKSNIDKDLIWKNPWLSENFHSVENGGVKPIFKTLFRKLRNDASIWFRMFKFRVPSPPKKEKGDLGLLKSFKNMARK